VENLQAAIAGETYEYSEMYPPMVEQARSENHKAKTMLEYANQAERIHADLYRQAWPLCKRARIWTRWRSTCVRSAATWSLASRQRNARFAVCRPPAIRRYSRVGSRPAFGTDCPPYPPCVLRTHPRRPRTTGRVWEPFEGSHFRDSLSDTAAG